MPKYVNYTIKSIDTSVVMRYNDYMNTNGFFNDIYEIVAKIPKGSVTTYGMIARLLGRPNAARIVGWAMNSAPSDRDLPCHRVVNKAGDMAPNNVFGGADLQRAILESEGVTFLADGRIDMDKHLWFGFTQ